MVPSYMGLGQRYPRSMTIARLTGYMESRYASSLSLANSTAVTLRAALFGLASDAPGRRGITGTAAPSR